MFKVPITVLNLIKKALFYAIDPNNRRKVVVMVLVLTLMYVAQSLVEGANR